MQYKIRAIRESMGMTQQELSHKSGISRATISNLEQGTERITTTETLSKIAAALNVRVSDIFLE